MGKVNTMFMELVQVALGNRQELSLIPNSDEWNKIFVIAQKQAVEALVLLAVDKLSKNNLRLSSQLTFEWICVSEQIAAQNRVVNQRCIGISKLIANTGYRSCILKGQGNAMLYDNPLSRTSGDIDIWVDAEREKIKHFVLSHFDEAEDSNLHIDFPIFNDVPVEIHYYPTIARSHKFNKRLQNYYDEWADKCFQNRVSLGVGEICVPVPELNVVMQMSHVMGHFFEEGIGLRQIVDLYFLLKKTGFDRPKMENKLRYLGMGAFSRAMMWVLHYELGLEENYLIAKPDKKRGRLLMKEILSGGNFGRFDLRRDKDLYSKIPLVYKIMRNMRFVWLFPMESFISPAVAKISRK